MATTTHAERGASGEHRVDGDRLYRLLHAELSDAGCLRPAPVQSAVHGALVLLGYAAAYTTLLTAPGTAIRVLALAALAFLCVQAGFVAHEAGHGAITRHRRVRAAIGQVFNTLLTALCYSYFRHIHRRHHPHCNDRGRDPDMQSSFFSMYPESARTKRGLGKLISRHQSFLIWILVSLQPFTLKLDSMQFLWRNPRTTRVDQIFLALHFMLWLAVPAAILGLPAALLNYALMSLLTGPYLGVIFLVNHIGTRIVEPHEPMSFFMQEVSTTRNLGSSRLHDLFFGGINNHIEHHLFPTVPTIRLRKARPITRAFCRRHGVPYREMSWRAAAREVTQHFRAMSAFVPRS